MPGSGWSGNSPGMFKLSPLFLILTSIFPVVLVSERNHVLESPVSCFGFSRVVSMIPLVSAQGGREDKVDLLAHAS